MSIPSDREVYRIEEHIGWSTLESVRSLWKQFQNHPNADIDFYTTIIKSRPDVVNPVVLVLFKNDIPVALAAGRLEKVKLPLAFGYLSISRLDILRLTVVYGGLMGVWDPAGSTAYIRHLRHLMRREHIDAVYLAPMRPDNQVYNAAKRLVPFFLRNNGVKNNLHWWAEVPDSFETFLKKINSKHRTQLRSKERKLIQHFGGTMQMKIFHSSQEVPPFCAVAEKIAQSTYLRGLGEGFYHNEEMRNRLNLAACHEWFYGYVLYVHEQPCAFWLGTLYNNVFYLDYTGFDTELKEFAAGQILFIKMIEHLCGIGTVRGIDFGFGDAEYKRRYGDRFWEESDMYLFNTTPRMLLTNLAGKSIMALSRTTAKILKHFDLFARIKKRWRMSAEQAVSEHKNTNGG